MTNAVIRTSKKGWAKELAVVYKSQTPATVIDDAHIGIDPRLQTLFDMTRRAGLTAREIGGVCVGCGMGIVGTGLLVAAVLDPEPLSKSALAVGGGIAMVIGGGGGAFYVLTGRKPPSVGLRSNGEFVIRWE